MVLSSFLAAVSVLACIVVLKWLIYRNLLHQEYPFHLVGALSAAIVTFVFVWRWQSAMRERQQEMLRRFETIARMNDRIRNALQVIACATYAENPETAEHVRHAVATIDRALDGFIAETRPSSEVHEPANDVRESITTTPPGDHAA
jgi:hypothetical protein